ncbi:MAG: DNA pilot protein [Microvirus sp.]|nr:MAG: DNA pilot protein [Microvirus sp.]
MSLFSNLLPAIGNLLGGDFGQSLGSGYNSYVAGQEARQGQEATNATNIAIADKQMAFQERMSDTAYQRQVLDMQKAGINPMLAATTGGGATTPAGANTRVENPVSTGMSSALQSAQTLTALQQLKQSAAQIDQTRAETARIQSETYDTTLNTAYRKEQLDNLRKDTYGKGISNTRGQIHANREEKLNESDTNAKQAENALKEIAMDKAGMTFGADVAQRKAESKLTEMEIPKQRAESQFYEGLGKANPYLQLILQLLKGGASARYITR